MADDRQWKPWCDLSFAAIGCFVATEKKLIKLQADKGESKNNLHHYRINLCLVYVPLPLTNRNLKTEGAFN